jgi:GDSL-like Lipase/Acylhydrolase family
MQSIPVDSDVLVFAGALDLERTGTGFIPRRLPAWTKPQITDMAMDAVVQLPAGVRLTFTTSATAIALDLQLTLIRQMPRDLRPAVFDLVIDGELASQSSSATGNVIALGPASDDIAFEVGGPTTISFPDLPPEPKAVEIWLPAHAAVEFRAIRVSDGATVERFTQAKPQWIHYGSSISHCVGAASPGKTWPGMVARSAGLEHTNLGFAGQCMLDPFVARAIRDSDADVISLKVAANIIGEDAMHERPFGPALHGFLDTIREGKPQTPILVVSPIFSPFSEDHPGPLVLNEQGRVVGIEGLEAIRRTSLTMRKMRSAIESIVAVRRRLGDQHLHYLNGLDLFGPADAGDLPDDLHPNDAGNERIAARFARLAFGVGGPLAGLAS